MDLLHRSKTSLSALADRWREEAIMLEAYGATEAASSARKHAHELAEAVQAAEDERLTVKEASKECGYSERHLRELVASGRVQNAGRDGPYRIRRGDLPRRAPGPASAFDSDREALKILSAESPR